MNASSIQVQFKHEKTYSPSSKTPIRPKVDPKTSKISVANETSALDPIEPWIKLSIERSTLQSNHIGLYRLADIKPLGQQAIFIFQLQVAEACRPSSADNLTSATEPFRSRNNPFPSAQAFILSGREHNSQQTAVKSESYNRCNQSNSIQV